LEPIFFSFKDYYSPQSPLRTQRKLKNDFFVKAGKFAFYSPENGNSVGAVRESPLHPGFCFLKRGGFFLSALCDLCGERNFTF
jgi:hypothetical protein